MPGRWILYSSIPVILASAYQSRTFIFSSTVAAALELAVSSVSVFVGLTRDWATYKQSHPVSYPLQWDARKGSSACPSVNDLSVPLAGKRCLFEASRRTGTSLKGDIMDLWKAKGSGFKPSDYDAAIKKAWDGFEPAKRLSEVVVTSPDAGKAVEAFVRDGIVVFPGLLDDVNAVEEQRAGTTKVWDHFKRTRTMPRGTVRESVRGNAERGWYSANLGGGGKVQTPAFKLLKAMTERLEPFIRSMLGSARLYEASVITADPGAEPQEPHR